ncbi:hypothetical protein [Deinococcus alpinitundrae]|uniref:hypothetical protein n=1 Tax=Deinococcus alpinitundrae TaxID=468913 RepID=UPI00137B7CEA|nr:hypothetical protein [Deinococcus alpinitundrae]
MTSQPGNLPERRTVAVQLQISPAGPGTSWQVQVTTERGLARTFESPEALITFLLTVQFSDGLR